MGIIIFVVIEAGLGYYLQKYQIIIPTYGVIVHWAVVLVVVPLLIGYLLKMMRTPQLEALVFIGGMMSAAMLYFYYREAWKVPPTIFHIFGFAFITGVVAYLAATLPYPIRLSHFRKDSHKRHPQKDDQRIFICYRREDSAATVGRIYDRLVAHFGRNLVFKDVDDVPPGVDFRAHLKQLVNNCEILIAIIGSNWTNVRNENGELRLSDPHDYVRIEIEIALERDIVLIPVLAGAKNMPNVNQLPASVSDFAFRQAISIRDDPDFHSDINKLIKRLDDVLKR